MFWIDCGENEFKEIPYSSTLSARRNRSSFFLFLIKCDAPSSVRITLRGRLKTNFLPEAHMLTFLAPLIFSIIHKGTCIVNRQIIFYLYGKSCVKNCFSFTFSAAFRSLLRNAPVSRRKRTVKNNRA